MKTLPETRVRATLGEAQRGPRGSSLDLCVMESALPRGRVTSWGGRGLQVWLPGSCKCLSVRGLPLSWPAVCLWGVLGWDGLGVEGQTGPWSALSGNGSGPSVRAHGTQPGLLSLSPHCQGRKDRVADVLPSPQQFTPRNCALRSRLWRGQQGPGSPEHGWEVCMQHSTHHRCGRCGGPAQPPPAARPAGPRTPLSTGGGHRGRGGVGQPV